VAEMDPLSLEGYTAIMRHLSASQQDLPLRPMVNRLMTRAALSTEPGAHMGMALESYTNCTSPLRKYVDFLAHLQIKSALRGEAATHVTAQMLEELAARVATARSATLEAERWLAGRYLAKLAAEEGATFKARISHINSSGFTVRLDDSGLEGLVDLRRDPEKFSYDKWTASLTSTTRRFQLEQPVELTFRGVDGDAQRLALFELVPGSGLKPPREEKADADPS